MGALQPLLLRRHDDPEPVLQALLDQHMLVPLLTLCELPMRSRSLRELVTVVCMMLANSNVRRSIVMPRCSDARRDLPCSSSTNNVNQQSRRLFKCYVLRP